MTEYPLHFWIGMFAGPLVVSMKTWETWREQAAQAAEREGQPDLAEIIRVSGPEQIVALWDRVQYKPFLAREQ